ncbi:hypothetical protein GTQ34_14510 [Muricauda sp. JGD-17]|uniref:Uncharacterized protein n=1 Tax=Flagellimonas ochracea TaxID=2696472 RepID=A0A964TE17_9FLAO|nr:hypothetical protein [Allomuricauda ochracea]NAY93125.1 hypothetical protein [Allomuricauda ochracea]
MKNNPLNYSRPIEKPPGATLLIGLLHIPLFFYGQGDAQDKPQIDKVISGLYRAISFEKGEQWEMEF